jgi:hypothetical protein
LGARFFSRCDFGLAAIASGAIPNQINQIQHKSRDNETRCQLFKPARFLRGHRPSSEAQREY